MLNVSFIKVLENMFLFFHYFNVFIFYVFNFLMFLKMFLFYSNVVFLF